MPAEMTREVVDGPDTLPAPPAVGEEGMEGQEGEEKYSAQVLRRLHRDALILLRDYHEMRGPMEHPKIDKFMVRKLEGIVKEIEEIEAMFDEHHPDLADLEGRTYDDDVEEKDMDGMDLGEGEEVDDIADSGEEELEPPEEALEGMDEGEEEADLALEDELPDEELEDEEMMDEDEALADEDEALADEELEEEPPLGEKGMPIHTKSKATAKRIFKKTRKKVATGMGSQEQKTRNLRTLRNLDPTQEEFGSAPREEAREEVERQRSLTRKKNMPATVTGQEPADENTGHKALCSVCGEANCICEGGESHGEMLHNGEQLVDEVGTTFGGPLANWERAMAQNAREFTATVAILGSSEDQPLFGEEHKKDAYHHYKNMDLIGGGMTGMGQKRYPPAQTGATTGGNVGGEGASGVDPELSRNNPNPLPNKVYWDQQGYYDSSNPNAGKLKFDDEKQLPGMDGAEPAPEMTGETGEMGMNPMHEHRKMCKSAGVFFKALADLHPGAFSDQHRNAANQLLPQFDNILNAQTKDEDEDLEDEELDEHQDENEDEDGEDNSMTEELEGKTKGVVIKHSGRVEPPSENVQMEDIIDQRQYAGQKPEPEEAREWRAVKREAKKPLKKKGKKALPSDNISKREAQHMLDEGCDKSKRQHRMLEAAAHKDEKSLDDLMKAFTAQNEAVETMNKKLESLTVVN